MNPSEIKTHVLDVWRYLKEHPELNSITADSRELDLKLYVDGEYMPLKKLTCFLTFSEYPVFWKKSNEYFYKWLYAKDNSVKIKYSNKIIRLIELWEPK